MAEPTAAATRFPVEALLDYGTRVLEKRGMTAPDARVVTQTLVTADLFGFATHGIRRLRLEYDDLAPGKHTPRPNIRVVSETPAIVLLDGDNGPGPLTAVRGMERAIAMAKQMGVGVVVVRATNSFGAASSYSILALEQKFIGFCCANFSEANVGPKPRNSCRYAASTFRRCSRSIRRFDGRPRNL